MQNAIWKLTGLCLVVGLGFLVMIQAQRGLTTPDQDSATGAATEGLTNWEGQWPADDSKAADANAKKTPQVTLGAAEQTPPQTNSATNWSADDPFAPTASSPTNAATKPSEAAKLTSAPKSVAVDFAPAGQQEPAAKAKSEPLGIDFRQIPGTVNAPAVSTASHAAEENPEDSNVPRSIPFDPFTTEIPKPAPQAMAAEPAATNEAKSPAAMTAGLDEPVESSPPSFALNLTEPPIEEKADKGPQLLPLMEEPQPVSQQQAAAPLFPGDASDSTTKDSIAAASTEPPVAANSEPPLLQLPGVSPANSTGPEFVMTDAKQDNSEAPPMMQLDENVAGNTAEEAAEVETPSPEIKSESQPKESSSAAETPAEASQPKPAPIPEALPLSDDAKPADTAPAPKAKKQQEPPPFGDQFSGLPNDEAMTKEPAPKKAVPQPTEDPFGAKNPDLAKQPKPENQKTAKKPADDDQEIVIQQKEPAAPRIASSAAAPDRVEPLPQLQTANQQVGANLKIEKQAPASAVLGQPLIYSILVKNVGDSPATQVVVEDRVPQGAELTGTIPQAELIGRRLVWKLGTIASGKEKKISIRVIPTQEGAIGSVATVNFVAEVTAQTMITSPKLELQIKGPKQAKVGQTIAFTFRLENRGEGDAQDVYIRNILPQQLRHPGGDDLEYEVGELKAGQIREVTLDVAVVKPGPAINRAIATATGGISTEAKSALDVLGSSISLSRTGPKRRYAGRSAGYVNVVTNAGDEAITDLRLEEELPKGMDFLSATEGGKYDQQTRIVTWQIDRLEAKSKREFQINLLASRSGKLSSRVRVYDDNAIPAEVVSTTDVIGIPALSIETAEIDQLVSTGDEIALRVTLKNKGTAASTNLDVQLSLPPQVEMVGVRGLVQDERQQGIVHFIPVATLAPDEELTFNVILRAKQPGDVRIGLQAQANEMQQPLRREEAVVIVREE